MRDDKKAEKSAGGAPKPESADDGIITFEDFKRADLRTAKIIKAEKIEGADKLLRLQIDLGEASCLALSRMLRPRSVLLLA